MKFQFQLQFAMASLAAKVRRNEDADTYGNEEK